MKSVYGVLLLASFLALAHAYPGSMRSESADSDESKSADDLVLVLPSGRRDIFGDMSDSDDDDAVMPGYGWNPFKFESSPFDGLFTRMQEAVNRIKAEMAAALASQLGQGGSLTPWGKIPEGANTTSTTKVIGDHKVTINETTYTSGDENGSAVYRVRVIDVKPLNETTEAVGTEAPDSEDEQPTRRAPEAAAAEDREELTTPGSRSVETVEDLDNEIPKSQVDTLTA